MKGAAAFRGVPMPVIRSTLRSWYTEEGLDDPPASDRKQLALDLLGESYSEDKLAGVLLLREHVLAELGVDDLPAFAAAFGAGHIADWGVCDWPAPTPDVPQGGGFTSRSGLGGGLGRSSDARREATAKVESWPIDPAQDA